MIVSGHTHTTLEEAIRYGDTYVVSAGSYCENLGELHLSRKRKRQMESGGIPAESVR